MKYFGIPFGFLIFMILQNIWIDNAPQIWWNMQFIAVGLMFIAIFILKKLERIREFKNSANIFKDPNRVVYNIKNAGVEGTLGRTVFDKVVARLKTRGIDVQIHDDVKNVPNNGRVISVPNESRDDMIDLADKVIKEIAKK